MKTILATLLLAALTSPLAAQNLFRSSLNSAQETPPNASTAVGWGTVVLNTSGTVTYHVEVVGLVATAAHIHVGAPGVPGGIIVTLAGGPTVWDGTSASPLGAADVAALRAGGTYFNVHTAAFGGGEIRGQILPAPANFAATADGSQETPPSGSAATGSGTFVVNPDRSITYNVFASGLTATAAHIHTGFAGAAGPILFTLVGGPNSWSGTTVPMSVTEFELLQAKGMYLNIHTVAFAGGEIRGQLVAEGQSYGFGCPGAGGHNAQLLTAGAPLSGDGIKIAVLNGMPNGNGTIAISKNPTATLMSGCQVFIKLPPIATIPVSLDAGGNMSMLLNLPNIPADRTFYLQFAGFMGGLSYTSNGLALSVEVL